MVRKLTSAIIVASALNTAQVYALGLGELQLHSALNQPLEAEIKLLNVGDLTDNQVLVNLAGIDEFERAGVERSYFLSNLKFEVEMDEQGHGVIKIKTQRLVNEPYLNFVVEARWPAGRLLREYTALLDLPIYDESNTTTTVNLGSSDDYQAPRARQTAQTEQTMPQTSAPVASPMTAAYQGDSYRIRTNDTLWSISSKVRASKNVSIQQTMVALQKLNPSAFINNNINLLKAGQVLRVPDENQVREISARSALRQVAQQNREWREGDTGAQIDATERATQSAPRSYSEEGRLSLRAAATSADAAADAAASGDVEALRNQLAASQENLDKAILDNEELQAEKASIQEQLESLQHLLELKNDQLAALQAAAVQDSKEKDSVETAEVAQVAKVATTAEETTDGDQLAPAAVEAEADKAEIESKPPEAEVVAEVKKPDSAATMKREQPQPESTLSRQLMDNAAYIGGGLLALLLVLGGILLKRRAAAAEEEAAAILAEEDESTEPDFDNEQEDDSEDFDELADTEDDYEEDEDDESPSTTQSETGDAIGEADIYVAYGRFQHAIDLLKNAISSEPQRSDLRVKLLEVYLEAEDQQGFQQQFVELQTLGDEDAIGQVKEMLSSVDGASDWLDNVSVAEPAESEAMAFDEAVEDSEFLEEDDADIELDLGEIDEEEASDLIEYDLEGIDLGTRDSKPEVEVAAVAQDDVLDDSQSMDDGFELDLVEEEPIDSLDFEESLDESGLGLELGDEDSEGLVLEDDGSMELGEDLAGSVVEKLAEESDMELEVGEDLSDFDDLEEDLLETETDELAAVDELDVDLDLGDDLEGFDAEDLDAEADELDEHLAEGDDLAVDDDEFEFLSDADEVATKLDLARAYIDMGDVDGARDILEEVLQEGEEEQKSEANELLKRIV